MAFSSQSFIQKLALAIFLVAAIFITLPAQAQVNSSVQTYTDDVIPEAPLPQYDRYNSPLKAGQMTLQDVLQAHPARKPLAQPLLPPVVTSKPSPFPLVPGSQASSENLMLQQGLKSVLQQPGTGKPVKLQAPQLQQPGATTTPEQLTPTAETAVPMPVDEASPPGVKFVPGEQPKNLAGGTAVKTATPGSMTVKSPSPTSPVVANDNVEESSAATDYVAPEPKRKTKTVVNSDTANGCQPHVENWTKTCVEAGYPDNFVGKISGETRTVCPDNSLQDVWIANSCAPPEEGGATAAVAPTGAVTNDVVDTVSNARATAIARNSMARTDASCGPANGLAASAAPVSDLCTFGDASEVSGDGPWRWNCKGVSGGMTVSCAAPVSAAVAASPASTPAPSKVRKNSSALVAEDGLCGSSDGIGTDHAPASNLCARGAASRVNGSGPWTWACSGENGGQAAACSAARKVDGVCGSAGHTGADQMPTNDLCTAGYASAVTGEGPWNWTCSGLYGGNPATCSAAPKRDAVCGSASLNGHRETPHDNLCSVGDAGTVHGSGPWSWNCNGANGGSPVSCMAPVSVNGICGNANGVAASRAPSEELCAHGTATRVTGSGPWSWNCSGSDGGDTQSCTAPMVSRQQQQIMSEQEKPAEVAAISAAPSVSGDQENLCGSASELMALEAPDKELCANGKASDVVGNGPWTWTCDDGSHTSNCATLSPVKSFGETKPKPKTSAKTKAPAAMAMTAPTPAPVAPVEPASCGSAAGQGAGQAPVEGLCSVGKASTVKGAGPWHWTCIKDKTKAACDAPKLMDGACGPANGSVQKFVPVKGLCSGGSPTDVQGTGPWLWTCVGTGGGSSISCSASAQSQTRVDGSCGAASNSPAVKTPDANLCDSGVASTVYGEGPWTWTCSGLNGGIATSCSAQKNTPIAPPPPGPSVNGLCGNANGEATVAEPVEELCSTGTATSVSGHGPWNWNCLGSNGGMTVSCTAPLQPPAPITGVCGAANGVPTLTTPRSGLCSAGISSAVSGKGPWTWSCSGTNGGGAVGCVAPLAGTDVGALPSLSSTPVATEAPVPMAAPTSSVTSSGLVTPRLQPSAVPAGKGRMPRTPPEPNFGAMPQPTPTPMPPMLNESNLDAPSAAPDLPDGTTGLQPPVIRDTLSPSPALRPPVIDSEGNVIPGNRFVLSGDVSTIPFLKGSENINPDETPTLDRLAAIMQSNGGVRITLTSYADNSNGMSPREARRLSLTRALAVRDYLTAKGISSGRIDVRALGANAPGDMPLTDKIDVKAN